MPGSDTPSSRPKAQPPCIALGLHRWRRPRKHSPIRLDALLRERRLVACGTCRAARGRGAALRRGCRRIVADRQPDWRLTAGAASESFELGDGGGRMDSRDGRSERSRRGWEPLAGCRCKPPVASGDGPRGSRSFWRSPASPDHEKRQFVDFQNDVTVADLRPSSGGGLHRHRARQALHDPRHRDGAGADQRCSWRRIVAEMERRHSVGCRRRSRTRVPTTRSHWPSLAGSSRVGPSICALCDERRFTPGTGAHGGILEPGRVLDAVRAFYRMNGADAFSAGIAEACRAGPHGGMLLHRRSARSRSLAVDVGALPRFASISQRSSTIKIGHSKYMVNLREDGMVLDDGLVLRLADDRFLATTSSDMRVHMMSHFEYYRDSAVERRERCAHRCHRSVGRDRGRRPRLAATRWGAVLGVRPGTPPRTIAPQEFAERPSGQERELRVLRASFSGELAFELHCRPDVALSLWQGLAGAGLAPYGPEALDILRVEKGYLTDTEINGSDDAASILVWRGLVEARQSLHRPRTCSIGLGCTRPPRPRLVGSARRRWQGNDSWRCADHDR